MVDKKILDVQDLTAVYSSDGIDLPVLRNINLKIREAQIYGLVGESGSGKTTVGRLALRLLEPTEGKVIFDKIDLSTLSAEELRLLRSRMQVIFQDPMASLNPRMTVIDA
ncbi:MAG: ATP-binding cassette domain-containing protein, partial [Anaerolineales bacterium]|nr:ATP-binding cassette domain-containing protein [Anaerolineales bacterium]